MRKRIVLFITIFCCFGFGYSQVTTEIKSNDVIIRLDEKGEIQRIFINDTLHEKYIKGVTLLEDCEPGSKVISTKLPNGCIKFNKVFISKKNRNHKCIVTESFVPAENSIRWKLIIIGTGEPWTTGIQTILSCERTDKNKFWTTWGDPNQTQPCNTRAENIYMKWANPFQTMPFRDMHLVYGGHCRLGGGYSIPLLSIVDEIGNSNISLIMSPEDMLFDVHLETTAKGEIKQSRYYNRISKGNPISFTMDIIASYTTATNLINLGKNQHPTNLVSIENGF